MKKASALVRVLGDASSRALVTEVRALSPRVLAQLVERVGLEDAGELVALATTEQLTRVLDEDLWKSEAPGEDEAFDDGRFALWLEVLSEAGDEHLATLLTELPEELLLLGLARRLYVFDLDALMNEIDAAADKALESSLTQEIGTWLLVAREHDGWDALVSALVTLDRDHHDALERILERVAAATERATDDAGGLYEVLTEAESIAEDAAADREERRAKEGYLAPSSARAFLRLAMESSIADVRKMTSDPITRGYFRDLDRSAAAPEHVPERLRELVPRALPRARKRTAFGTALEALPEEARGRIFEELAYLTNVLVAGRGLRPIDAAEEVMRLCEVGLADAGRKMLERELGAVRLFRIGLRLGVQH